ncbi:hypothetical protein pEaSNUABM22_00053 [Erwinia phage pEa_SNUABM_22]|uniref:Uncharacterized protein n=1 Tax=Erwinia phage pEa_SNUABM_22 TaxID=2869549 RepID=A0AAE8XQK5_9CAUD|nr:hypothetical protein MPK63_gp053 [Erwinia phage pEa_SNUABM_22]UAW96541.1 hypothetical protein pEaSNUABM22_00053 [Erwinia phage pEa_SNUABM_22]
MKEKVEELRQYVLKRVNENAQPELGVGEEAIRSHARDVVEGIMKSLKETSSGIRVVCDESNNPKYNIDNNILTLDLLISDPHVIKIIFEGNDNAKTSVGFIQQEAIVPKDV